jgi:hypothetical protein
VSVALQLLLVDRTADGTAVQLKVHFQQGVRNNVATAILQTEQKYAISKSIQ